MKLSYKQDSTYAGAIKNWVNMVESESVFFSSFCQFKASAWNRFTCLLFLLNST